MGKLPSRYLESLLREVYARRDVVIPPKVGYDSGVHRIGKGQCLVVSTDPCLGVPLKWFGWLMVNYAASDVAIFGARPEGCAVNLLGPPGTRPHVFRRIMRNASDACKELAISVVTGHTGTYDGLTSMVGTCTAYGRVTEDKLITPGGARAGDAIIMTKAMGLETLTNFAIAAPRIAKKLFGTSRALSLSRLVKAQSCVREALVLSKLDGVHAMHDTAEGGLVAALNEMADAAGLGFTIYYDKLTIPKELSILRSSLNLTLHELLSISSTGSILAALAPSRVKPILKSLRSKRVQASVIGRFDGGEERVLVHEGVRKKFPSIARDPYAKILSYPSKKMDR